MRICFVCNEYPPGPHGGIGTFTQVMARGLVGAGHEVRVIGAYDRGHPAPDSEEDQGVRVWRLRIPEKRFGWVQARHMLYRQVAAWARAGEIDLIEMPDWTGWGAGWPRLAVPVVVRLNGSASYFANEMGESVKRLTFTLERSSLRRADFWCSVSRYTAQKTQRLFGLRAGPQAILHNPVEMPWVSGDEAASTTGDGAREGQRVVFTGTLTAKKGILSLFQAWPRVLEECPEARLHVYGKDGRMDGGSMQDFLMSRLDERAKPSVQFHGHAPREELFKALQTARLAVFPSYAEAFALAPLEAMAWGCPTIYSRRGSGPELIEHGRNGLLVDPDRPAEIAQEMVHVLKDDGLAGRLAKAGRESVRQKFSIGALLAQNEAFYRGCVGEFGKRASHGR